MFTSGNYLNPFFNYSTEPFLKHPYTYDDDDQNPNLAEKEPPFIINFTSPNLLDDHDLPLSEILRQKQPSANYDDMVSRNENNISNSTSVEMAKEAPIQTKPSRKRNLGATPRKRTGKKDRHSKICTAQGIRDRRMRLSLQIARKFFDLQDMLGFDKASKTIEWLFSKSKKAIKELSENVLQTKDSSSSRENSDSFMSECEVVSAMEENSNSEGTKLPKVAYDSHHGKESREKARARARERTKEKMMIKTLEKTKQFDVSNPKNSDQMGCTRAHSEVLIGSPMILPLQRDSNPIEHHQFTNFGITTNHPWKVESRSSGSEHLPVTIKSWDQTLHESRDSPSFFGYQNTCDLSRLVGLNNGFAGYSENCDSFTINSSNNAITNIVSQEGNRASTSLAPSKFPFNLR